MLKFYKWKTYKETWGATSQVWIQNQMPLWKILCIHPNTSLPTLPSRKPLIMRSHQEVSLAFQISSSAKNSKAHLCIHPELQTFLLNTEPQPLNPWPPSVQIQSRKVFFQTWSSSEPPTSKFLRVTILNSGNSRFWKVCQKEGMLLNFSGLPSGSPSVKWKEFITHHRGECDLNERIVWNA